MTQMAALGRGALVPRLARDRAAAPRLPAGLTRLAFPTIFRGRRLQVEVTPQDATYSLCDGALQISHWGERIDVIAGSPVTRAIPPAPNLPAPAQPASRAPARRSPRLADTFAMHSEFGGHAHKSAEAA